MNTKTRFLVWDLPVRLFHWLLAAGFGAALIIVYGFGDHSPAFPYHAMVGLVLVFMVVLRIVWGIVGTRWARFSSFLYGPGKVTGYLKDVFTNGSTSYTGHNPGSSWAIFVMLLLLIGLALSGIQMAQGVKGIKDVHEFFATALMITVGAHILGVIIHTIRKRENITASMIHGKKAVPETDAIKSSMPLVALVLIILTAGWAYSLFSSYNAATGTTKLPILGTTLQIGEENEQNESEKEEKENDRD